MSKKRIATAIMLALVVVSIYTKSASAHVTVKPAQLGVAQFQNFSVSVPTEKNIPTTSVRLVIPEGVENVRPNVKPGWKIEIKKQGEGELSKVTELIWSSGSIPTDQRDEFVFSAKTPATPTTLVWKAYQTHQDGSVVSWDQEPKKQETNKEEDFSKSGPYSKTEIIDDLRSTNQNTNVPANPQQSAVVSTTKRDTNTQWISYAALLISVISLGLTLRKRT